jgi:hypothetical protein
MHPPFGIPLWSYSVHPFHGEEIEFDDERRCGVPDGTSKINVLLPVTFS